MLFIFSFSGIFSKYASYEEFFSARFCLFYLALLLVLGIYAIGWQQIIRKLSLSLAFAHKSVTVIWGMLWGIILFHETISLGKCIGIILIVTGICLFAKAEENQ